MSIIDTKAWKAFRLGDLFDVFNGKKYVAHKRTPGSLPLVSNSTADNGIGDFIADRPDNVWSNFISVAYGSGTGIAFYHEQKAFVGETVMALVPKFNMTPSVGIFIAGVLTRYGADTYKYERKPKVDEYRTEVTIMLPATPDGQPDWAYMDAYMSEVLKKEEVFAEHLASLTAEAVVDGHPLDTSSWKAFRIGELFEIRKGRRLTKAAQIEGDTAFIGATMFNNGVTAFIGNNEHVFPGHCLSVCYNGAVGVTFFQKDDFWASDDVNALYSKTAVSDLCLMFMAPLIEQVGKQNFAYVDKWTQELMAVSEIYLPVTSDGQPDWAWMEQYMQQQMDKAGALVEHLDAVFNDR